MEGNGGRDGVLRWREGETHNEGGGEGWDDSRDVAALEIVNKRYTDPVAKTVATTTLHQTTMW